MAGGSLADDCCPEELGALVEHGYSISWSAWRSSVCGIVSLSAFAALRLITSSNFVGCSTGRSVGLAPLRILSTKDAARLRRPRCPCHKRLARRPRQRTAADTWQGAGF